MLTADIRETLKHMLEYFTPEDKKTDDTTINSSEHKLKIRRTQLITKTSPYRKSEMQLKAWGIKSARRRDKRRDIRKCF